MISIKRLAVLVGIIGLAFAITSSKTATQSQEVLEETVIIRGIDFKTGSLEEAKAEAKATGKLIFIDAYTDWCGPCKHMQKTTFRDIETGNFFNKNFVNFKLEIEKHKDGQTVAQQYGITAYPTLLFIDSNGTLVKKSMGKKNVNQLMELANSVL